MNEQQKKSKNENLKQFITSNKFEKNVAQRLILYAAKKEIELKSVHKPEILNNFIEDNHYLWATHDNQSAVVIKVNKK